MTSIRVRPRFRKLVREPMEKLQTDLEHHVAQAEGRVVKGNSSPGFLVLKVPPEDTHFWSPQLSLEFEETEEGTLIRGLYGPNPGLWALFAFGYAVIGIMALFTAIISSSAISLGKESPFLWLLPVYAVLALGLYLVGQFGQKLGAAQTFMLHHFFEEAIGDRVHVGLI